MINRRSLMLGAAAVAAAPTAATALPARVFERLDVIPCDGRELPIAQYLDLFDGLGQQMYDTIRKTFLVPVMQPMFLGERVLYPHVILKGPAAGTARYLPHD